MQEKPTSSKREHTAVHEAGHAVAHVRLGILQGDITIKPNETIADSVTAEGRQHVWSAEEAPDMVLAYCAGYGALIAAGLDDAAARLGADDDFDNAEQLIGFWGLDGNLESWLAKTVEMMRAPANLLAVRGLAAELLEAETLDMDDVHICCAIADGEATEEDYAQFKQMRSLA